MIGKPMDDVKQEHRASARQKSFLQGRAMFNNRRSSIDCIVRDVSDNGARLKFSIPPAIPEVFELHIPNKDETYRARVIWHDGADMGVHLSTGEPSSIVGVSPVEEKLAKLEREVAALRRRLDEAGM